MPRWLSGTEAQIDTRDIATPERFERQQGERASVCCEWPVGNRSQTRKRT